MGFGAMDVTKPYEFMGFGAMDVNMTPSSRKGRGLLGDVMGSWFTLFTSPYEERHPAHPLLA